VRFDLFRELDQLHVGGNLLSVVSGKVRVLILLIREMKSLRI